jgi:oxysterol-binding protein-related protein 3/6/7
LYILVDLLTVSGYGSKSASNENLAVGEDSASIASQIPLKKLKIGELIEVIPIRKYNSFEYTLQGSYTIPLAGTFVLHFDNSFSIGTSKHLFYHAYLSTDIVPSPSATPQLLSSSQIGSLCAAGWISKRRTGVVRSWGRRWFQLDSLGVLSYFLDRASPLRGSIFVPDCSLIIANNTLRFSLDSGSQIFHLKAYKKEEFDFWIEVLSSFRHFGPPTTISSSFNLPSSQYVNNSAKNRLDEAFKFVRERLDRLPKMTAEPMNKSVESIEISETIGKLESIYDMLKKTREALDVENEEFADAHEGEADAGDFDEIFYDVNEIYVDEIDDEKANSLGEFSEDEFFEPENGETLVPEVVSQRVAIDWLVEANVKMEKYPSNIYRTNLPFPAPPINISFASVIMRKSFPVALNEPINLLQRLAEELEYSDLLDRAAALNGDPVEQMVQIAAFAISGYASSIHRSERKPYNPILGETYEYIRPDRGFRFVSEKVSHQPVIVACNAESSKWRFWQDAQAETKLWGKSMLINPKGKINVEILDQDTGKVLNHFTWGKVNGALRNIYSAKKSIENYGELVIKSHGTGYEARITFKESGMFSNSGNEIYGGIFKVCNDSESLVPIVTLSGRWDDTIFKEIEGESLKRTGAITNNNLLQVIWRTNPLPNNYAQFFCLTSYSITLNDFPSFLKTVLPKTDSRYRPDQRMLESGMVDAADLEKQRIEQLQRDRRAGEDMNVPLWFTYDKSSKSWKFNGKYWEERSNKFCNVKLPQLW